MSEVVSDPSATGWDSEIAHKRYLKYVADQHGDVTDLPRLCSVMFNAGGREALAASVEFGDIMPTLRRIEARTQALLRLLAAFAEDK